MTDDPHDTRSCRTAPTGFMTIAEIFWQNGSLEDGGVFQGATEFTSDFTRKQAL
jgi:hypothetical protein